MFSGRGEGLRNNIGVKLIKLWVIFIASLNIRCRVWCPLIRKFCQCKTKIFVFRWTYSSLDSSISSLKHHKCNFSLLWKIRLVTCYHRIFRRYLKYMVFPSPSPPFLRRELTLFVLKFKGDFATFKRISQQGQAHTKRRIYYISMIKTQRLVFAKEITSASPVLSHQPFFMKYG